MTEWRKEQICIKFGVKVEPSSVETIQMIQKATAMGNQWLAASLQQCVYSYIMSHAEFLGEMSNHPGDSVPLQTRFGTLQLLAFPKTKITFEREEISDHWWDSGKYNTAADGDWENCVRTQVPTLRGTEASLSYVQCFLYLVSSINACMFHITWLYTFQTDLTWYIEEVLAQRIIS